MLRNEIRGLVNSVVKERFGLENVFDFSVEVPESLEHGDYATNVALVLGKKLPQNPMEIAEEIVLVFAKPDYQKFTKHFSKITAATPGFINFYVSHEYLVRVLNDIVKKKEKFGKEKQRKKTIVIEYSSPNIAKPLGVHHLRTTIIGQALVNVLRFVGHKTISLSFPGDWGTQFGFLIAGYKRWGDAEKMKAHPISEMLDLYVRFSAAAKEDPTLLDEGRLEFKKLEDGNKENIKLWKWFRKESLRDFNRVYHMLGVKIEHTIGESYYEKELRSLIQDALKRGKALRGDDGSVVVPLPDSKTPEIIQKSDSATIYTTRELAAIRHRLKKWKADKLLYVSDNRAMAHHLSQVFKTAAVLGYTRPKQLEHVKFGAMLAPEGKKFATREGNLIPMEEVLNEAVTRARKVVNELNSELPENEKNNIARIVGIGAVKFFDLMHNRMSDIVFDWDKMLTLKGASAPYLQYAYARIKSILRKSKGGHHGSSHSWLLREKEETNLARHLLHFTEIIEDTATSYEPNHLAEYLMQLAEKINVLYEKLPVLTATGESKTTRLALLSSSAILLKSGLTLLGIEVPERM